MSFIVTRTLSVTIGSLRTRSKGRAEDWIDGSRLVAVDTDVDDTTS